MRSHVIQLCFVAENKVIGLKLLVLDEFDFQVFKKDLIGFLSDLVLVLSVSTHSAKLSNNILKLNKYRKHMKIISPSWNDNKEINFVNSRHNKFFVKFSFIKHHEGVRNY